MPLVKRWVAGLANYKYKIFNKCGKQNQEADALSQINWAEQQAIVVKACLMSGAGDYKQFLKLPPETIYRTESSPEITESEWREEQNKNIDIGPVERLIKQNLYQSYKVKEDDPTGMKILMKYCRDLILRKGLLYRKVQLKINLILFLSLYYQRHFRRKLF